MFTCPHGHTWDAPPSGVSLIGGKYVACPVCAALVRVDSPSTVAGTDPVSLLKPASVVPLDQPEAATLLRGQLETWRRLPPIEITKIGDYDVQSELGRGGMGVVYRARHRTLKRVVALKMILAGEFASGDSLGRFQSEAEAVARMQHPGIVQIYEIGEQDKKPYFAMEFCDGGSLHDRLETPLPARQAAEMMVKVARAVHFAHQQGVIHRDLKPANILLTKDNQPKITDFGLAKRLDEAKGKTRTGDVLGTPSYMAPEQAEGKLQEIGAHTDVYALGTILYEMLTARQAFQAETAMDTFFQVIYEEPVAPARLVPRLPRDLETICLKCLSKDISKRYASAEELAKDLERFLEGAPIIARPAGTIEKAVKWARRRPALAGLVGVSALAAVGVLGLSLYFNIEMAAKAAALSESNSKLEIAAEGERKKAKEAKDNEIKARAAEKRAIDKEAEAVTARNAAETQRRLAEANFLKARAAVQSMLTEVGQTELAYVPLMEPVRRKLLTDALQFNKEFLEQKGNEPAIRRQVALSHQHLADIQRMLGEYAEADKENQEAIRQLDQLVKKYANEPDYLQDLAASYFQRGQLLRDRGRNSDAESAYQEARKLLDGLVKQQPRPEYRRELARTFNDLGLILRNTNRAEDAAKSYQQALALQQDLVKEFPDRPEYRDGLGGTLNDLGFLWRSQRKPDEAMKYYRRALAEFEGALERWPTSPDFRQRLAASRNNVGNTYLDLKDIPQALATLKQALAERQKLVDQFPSVLAYRQDLARTHNNLAAAIASGSDKEKNDKAAQEYAEALKIHRKLVEALPGFPDYQSQLAAVLDNLAALLSRQDQIEKARQLLDEAQSYHGLARKANPANPLYQLFARNHYSVLAETLVRQSEKSKGNAHREAAAAVAEMLKLKSDSADDYYRAATLLAACVPLAERDTGIPNAKAVAEKYGADAVGHLREALQRGLTDPERIKTSPLFQPLRGRADFMKLLGELK